MKPAAAQASLPLKPNGANENAGSMRPLENKLRSIHEYIESRQLMNNYFRMKPS